MLPEPVACYADRSVPPEARWRDVPWCDGGDDSLGWAEPTPEGAGSIIIVLATDAPLLPVQLKRLVTRTALGLARIGGMGYNGSGDIFLGFSTANRRAAAEQVEPVELVMLPNDRIDPLISATVHATEEAILNAMLAAEALEGINGYRVPALPPDALRTLMEKAASGFKSPG
jgi:D-aminopeptidase